MISFSCWLFAGAVAGAVAGAGAGAGAVAIAVAIAKVYTVHSATSLKFFKATSDIGMISMA